MEVLKAGLETQREDKSKRQLVTHRRTGWEPFAERHVRVRAPVSWSGELARFKVQSQHRPCSSCTGTAKLFKCLMASFIYLSLYSDLP